MRYRQSLWTLQVRQYSYAPLLTQYRKLINVEVQGDMAITSVVTLSLCLFPDYVEKVLVLLKIMCMINWDWTSRLASFFSHILRMEFYLLQLMCFVLSKVLELGSVYFFHVYLNCGYIKLQVMVYEVDDDVDGDYVRRFMLVELGVLSWGDAVFSLFLIIWKMVMGCVYFFYFG